MLKILGPTRAERFVQDIKAEDAVQEFGKLPGEHVAAVPVDDSDQVHEAPQQRHIGDVCAPDLIDMDNRQVALQIGKALATLGEIVTAAPWVDRLNTHQPHSRLTHLPLTA